MFAMRSRLLTLPPRQPLQKQQISRNEHEKRRINTKKIEDAEENTIEIKQKVILLLFPSSRRTAGVPINCTTIRNVFGKNIMESMVDLSCNQQQSRALSEDRSSECTMKGRKIVASNPEWNAAGAPQQPNDRGREGERERVSERATK